MTSIEANGLSHHVLEWGSPHGPPVLLVHGYMDAAATWDRVARGLAERGFHVIAPDMRGFGEGPRAPRGSYYHFADYVGDVAAIVEALCPNDPIALVGHSMGGTVATLYAGTFPGRVSRFANLEGLGPPDNGFESGPIRMRRWIEDLRKLKVPAPMTLDEARRRLANGHPQLAPETIAELVPHLVRDTPEGLVWRVDPLHRTTSPVPFFANLFIEFAKGVTCPVLYVSGGNLGYRVPDADRRLSAFARVEQVALDDAGHMMHWTQPAKLASALATFFESAQGK
jgi:pimeloyl-ACP methyl ester carboxylesterase